MNRLAPAALPPVLVISDSETRAQERPFAA